MAGQLKTHPLTELIREISAASLSGALRLTKERAKVVVYFDAGEIIYAVTNLRAYRLAESARRWNILSEQQLAAVQEKASDMELGSALVESGALSREMLDTLTERQVSELLRHALLWTDGDWEFDPRVRVAGQARINIKTKRVLVESARQLPTEFVAERFGDKDEKLLPETKAPDDLNLLPAEAFVLTRVDMPLKVGELLAIGGLPEAETLHIVYTLALGGFLRRERWPQALSPQEIAKALAVAKATAQAKPKAQVAAEPKQETKSAPVDDVSSKAQEPPDEQSEIDVLFAKAQLTTDHYQMLGVRRSATATEIKRAYYALAKRFHPDRFRSTSDEEQLTRIQSAFAKIAHAYEALKDQTTRASYDSKLLTQEAAERSSRAQATPKQPEAATAPQAPKASASESIPRSVNQQAEAHTFQAEERFKQGLSALQQGNSAHAIASFGEAARLAPAESRYRAYYGQALANDHRLRHSAEAELKAAISLDAGKVEYRIMLAELYEKIGLLKRAQGELNQVLAADPKNEAARRFLSRLKR